MTRDEAIGVLAIRADTLAPASAQVTDDEAVEALDVLQRLTSRLMGAKDVAEALGVKVPNLKHVKIEPITRISGGAIPVYLRADVEREMELRAERAAASE